MPRRRTSLYHVTWSVINILADSPQDAGSEAARLLRRRSDLLMTVRWYERGHVREKLVTVPFAGPHSVPPHLQLTESLLSSLTVSADWDSEEWRIWHDDSDNLYLTYKGRRTSAWRDSAAPQSWKHYRIIVDRLRVVNATRKGKRRYAFTVEQLPSNHRSWPFREVARVVAERFPVRGPMSGESGPPKSHER